MRHREQAVYVDRKPETTTLRTQLRQVIRAIISDRPLGDQLENGIAIAGIIVTAVGILFFATLFTQGP